MFTGRFYCLNEWVLIPSQLLGKEIHDECGFSGQLFLGGIATVAAIFWAIQPRCLFQLLQARVSFERMRRMNTVVAQAGGQ